MKKIKLLRYRGINMKSIDEINPRDIAELIEYTKLRIDVFDKHETYCMYSGVVDMLRYLYQNELENPEVSNTFKEKCNAAKRILKLN